MEDYRFSRYLAVFALTAAALIGAVWVYAAAMPLAFMESGYAAWRAKSDMLDRCDLGDLAFFGDSRLEASVIPGALEVDARNFGLPAATVLETSVAVDRALRCPRLPKQAVISVVGDHFGPVSKYYWYLTLRYGFMSAADLWAAEQDADRLGDGTVFAARTADGLGGSIRDWMYWARFPSLSFASLIQGRVFGRYDGNLARYHEVLQDRGWSAYTAAEPDPAPPPEGFVHTKLQDARFEAMVRALQARGVQVMFLMAPYREHHRDSDRFLADYQAYLADAASRLPGLVVVNRALTLYPDRVFADADHLAPEGAKRFSERLAACIAAAKLQPSCDLAWRDGQSAVLEVQ